MVIVITDEQRRFAAHFERETGYMAWELFSRVLDQYIARCAAMGGTGIAPAPPCPRCGWRPIALDGDQCHACTREDERSATLAYLREHCQCGTAYGDPVCHCGESMKDHHAGSSCTSPLAMVCDWCESQGCR